MTIAIGSGSATITVPAGTRLRVLGDAGSGLLKVAPGVADNSAPDTLTATIGTGRFVVGYPAGPRA
jgi:hypothetical protein